MRILVALALFMSFSAFAQRVRENVQQQQIVKSTLRSAPELKAYDKAAVEDYSEKKRSRAKSR